MRPPYTTLRKRSKAPRRGAALMLCLFILFLVTLMVVNVLDSTTLELASVRHSLDYERALYLANAGVHAAAAELEANPTWRGTLTEGPFPNDDSYSVTAVDGDPGRALVTSQGAAGGVVRTVTAILEF